MILTPLTKLDAVNEICGAMGEAPVDTLENSVYVDTINAVRMLEAETRAIHGSRLYRFGSKNRK